LHDYSCILLLWFVINALYNYYISNKGLLEECDKEENVEVTAVATTTSLDMDNPRNT
jgi:hypothetical protein